MTLGELQSPEWLIPRLIARGLSQMAAEGKSRLFRRVVGQLLAHDVRLDTAPVAWFVPGRIEVLGKHTDYAGGRSMLVAVEQGFCVAAVPRGDSTIRVADAMTGEAVGFEFGPELVPAAGHWSNYPMTVARRVARNFPGELRGRRSSSRAICPGRRE